MDFHSLPRVIFTSPTFAAAGLTDRQANAQGIDCECRVLPMTAVPRALVNRDTRGFVKIVAEAGSGRIIGASMVAEGAGDVIQAAVYAIQFGLTTAEVAATWAPYLTSPRPSSSPPRPSSSPPRPSPATCPSSAAARRDHLATE